MLTIVFQAAGLFAATNIDDLIILSLFFARGAGHPANSRNIICGQYLGFLAILGASLLSVWGFEALLPASLVAYCGLIPLLLGFKAAWDSWRGQGEQDLDQAKRVSVTSVAAVTFANGADNLGVYVPVFLSFEAGEVFIFCLIFLLLVAVLVWLAKFLVARPSIGEALEKWERILFPLVLITLGFVILVEGGAFGL